MNNADLIAKASLASAQRGVLSMWTIYDHPRDHPDAFVARRFEIGSNGPGPMPTIDVIITGELERLRESFQLAGLVVMQRSEEDDSKIVETWM